LLAGDAAAKDFVTDAHNHCKIVGYVEVTTELFKPPASPNASTTDTSPLTQAPSACSSPHAANFDSGIGNRRSTRSEV
jgi:hypothetical protein